MDRSAHVPLVSVVMIFRNAARFFDEAIESVLGQAHPALELLLCDDGSTDESRAIALRRADENPERVRYLHHPGHAHRGMSSTRNLGVEQASGEMVAFLDADDVWDPEHLRHDVAVLAAHPEVDMVCGRSVDWHSWRDATLPDALSPLPWPPGVVVQPPLMMEAVLRRGAYRIPTCSVLVRKSALDAAGRSEDEFHGMYEDQVLLAKLFLSHACIISGEPSARYRRHDDSATALAMANGTYHPSEPNPSREAFLRWLWRHLEERPEPQLDELHRRVGVLLESYAEGASPRRGALARGAQVARGVAGVPSGVARRVVLRLATPAVGHGLLRRVEPVSRQFGYDRGHPIDRHYIEQFLAENGHVISGDVLEIGDSEYTRRFGGAAVIRADVLNVDAGAPETTVVADLSDAPQLPSQSFDCVIITQTLHLIYDVRAAVATLHRILCDGGTVLATVPGITPLSSDRWADTWYWSFTQHSALRLFGEAFGAENVEVAVHGNVLSSVAFLEGLATHELERWELDVIDPQFPMLITVRAYRPKNILLDEPATSSDPADGEH